MNLFKIVPPFSIDISRKTTTITKPINIKYTSVLQGDTVRHSRILHITHTLLFKPKQPCLFVTAWRGVKYRRYLKK